ncbi:MAG: protease, partial [bacterium]
MPMLRRSLLLTMALAAAAQAQGTRLLRHPAINGNSIAFAYAGDLWVTARAGGPTRRLTSTPDVEGEPQFSPDGSMIAFTRTAAGNTDVYVVPSKGGDARRLTYHPGPDRVRGWTRDGKRVVFASDRASAPQLSFLRLFTVSADGGVEDALPMPRAFAGVYSPDSRRFAYEEISTVFVPDWYETSGWKHYRGGRTQPVRIIDLASNAVEKLPWKNSNDRNAMWVGSTVYFVSDRNGTANLYSYDAGTKAVKQLTRHEDFDVMNASADADAIVYEQAGYIHLLDLKTNQAQRLAVDVVADFPWARPQFKKVAALIRDAALSPTGVRAAFEARGEIFTVPTDKGDSRNLTQSSDAHEHDPAWSPDGAQLAWLSDAGGEHQLMIGEQSGLAKPRIIALPSGGTAYFSGLQWAPAGKHLLVEDNHLNLWLIDAATGRSVKVDADTYSTPGRQLDPSWSPDSRWITYSKSLDSHLRAIFVYSVADAKSFQVTDALADAVTPAFDAGGKYLYFLASTDFGPRTGWVEMSAVDRPVHRAIYVAVLNASDPSPLLPESGD